MAPHAWNTRISRRTWLLASLSLPVFSARGETKLIPIYDGDNLHVAAPPDWHFLTGKSLQRLKDGATVVYLAQLGLYEDAAFQRPIRLAEMDRFAVSYDIWDNARFSVTMLSKTRRKSPNLVAASAEAWCLENMAVSVSNLATDRRFWMRLEMHVTDQKDLSSMVAGPGISFAEIVLRLAKKSGADDPPMILEAGPLRLTDLVRTPGRG